MVISLVLLGLLATPESVFGIAYHDTDLKAIVYDSIEEKLDLLRIHKITNSSSGTASCIASNGLEGICTKLTKCVIPHKHLPPIEISSVESLFEAGKQCRGAERVVCCPSAERLPIKQTVKITTKLNNAGFEIRLGDQPECASIKQRAPIESECFLPADRPPYVAELRSKGRHLCSGSLINTNWILTAAQCIQHYFKLGGNPTNLKVRLADFNPSANDRTSKNGNDRSVKRALYHSEFDQSNQEHDIALIELSEAVTFSSNLAPVCLSNTEPVVDEKVTRIRYFPPPPGKRSMIVTSKSGCDNIFQTGGKEQPKGNTTFCGFDQDKGGACDEHDGGAPLVIGYSEEKAIQAGISSWYYGCRYVEVFTKVSSYLDWIETIMKS